MLIDIKTEIKSLISQGSMYIEFDNENCVYYIVCIDENGKTVIRSEAEFEAN